MLCWKKCLLLKCLLACLLMPWTVTAEGLAVKHAELTPMEEWYVLNANLDVGFSKPVEEALEKGIALNFVLELEITKPRWYWVDETIASVRQNIRISYHALTRQYHFSNNSGNLSLNSLLEAKQALNHIMDWRVFDRNLLKKGNNYQAAVRIKLDIKQLPKPLQVEAFGSKDWDLVSDWFQFPISLPPPQ